MEYQKPEMVVVYFNEGDITTDLTISTIGGGPGEGIEY